MTDALTTQWAVITAANPGANTKQKLDILNATMVAGPNSDVSIESASLYLASSGKLASIAAYGKRNFDALVAGTTLTSAQSAGAQLWALFQVPTFRVFNTSNPTAYTAIQSMLTAVASDAQSGIAAGDASALIGMSATQIFWWQANGFSGPITPAYLTAEGLS